MKVVWQIMVFINYIKNLDLYHQGEYALRVSIQSERSGRRARFVSNPQVECAAHAPEESTSRFDTSRQAARISRDGCGYTTASCYIRFRDETVNLNDAIVFEVPVDVNKDFSTETLLLHFALLYGKPVAHDTAATAAASRRPKSSGASATEPLEEVAVHSFRLNCGTRVLAGECLLLFDEMHRQVIAFPLLTNSHAFSRAADASYPHTCSVRPFTSPPPPPAPPCPTITPPPPRWRHRLRRETPRRWTCARTPPTQAVCRRRPKRPSPALNCCAYSPCSAAQYTSFAPAYALGSKTLPPLLQSSTPYTPPTPPTRSCSRALSRSARAPCRPTPPKCRTS